jgi:hypothetical protein
VIDVEENKHEGDGVELNALQTVIDSFIIKISN